MAEYRVLARPPIVEALIDLRFSVPDDFSYEQLHAHVRSLAGGAVEEIQEFTVNLDLDSPGGSTHPGPKTAVIKSADETIVRQFRRVGFTVSVLRSYTTWDALEMLAKETLGQFLSVCGDVRLVRVATRFINEIELPSARVDLDDYLTHGPKLPCLASITEFNCRVAGKDEQNRMCIVTVSTKRRGPGAMPSIVIDIDAFKSASDPAGLSLESVWEELRQLRNIKNDAFFGSVQEFALERYS